MSVLELIFNQSLKSGTKSCQSRIKGGNREAVEAGGLMDAAAQEEERVAAHWTVPG